MEREYIAFISYRHAKLDSAAAKALHTLIEQYRIPKDIQPGRSRKLGLVFRDQEELHASSDLSGEIQEALKNSEFLIVVCSENTAESPWVSREIGHFLETHDRDHILTVLASGEPMEVFPEILTHVKQPDGSVEILEPLALDIRGGNLAAMRRKLRREAPRLIAAMLDCPYDALVLREQKRKFRRFTAAAALILAVILTFTSMVVAKNREIAGKNTELARQKAEIQLRESELLTQDAREALDKGDFLSAIENAAAALPKATDADRPYYAPAEGVLMEALNIFHTKDEDVILSHRDLEQITAVADFCINADGTRLLTTDDYGTITCFDTQSTKILWQTTIPQDYSLTSRMLIADELNLVFVQMDSALASLDLDTGAVQWQQGGNLVRNYLFYHAESRTLVYVEQKWEEQDRYYLVFVDAETGENRNTLLLAESNFVLFYTFCNGATFSEDGSCFLGTFVDDDYVLHCFRADLTTGRCDIIYRHATPGTYEACAIKLALTDRTIRIVATGTTETAAMTFLEIDQESGTLIRQWNVMEGEYHYFSKPFAVLYDTLAIFALYDHMVLLDLETGNILDEVQFFDRIVQLQPADSRLCFCLADGTCGLVWINTSMKFVLSSDAFFNVSAELDDLQSAKVWGHGIIQLYTEGGTFAISVSNMIGPGYVAAIPKDAENTVRIFQPITLESPTTLHSLFSDAEKFSGLYDCTIRRHGDLFLIGPVETEDAVTGETKNYILALDAKSRQILEQIHIPDGVYMDDIFLLPDGTGFLEITWNEIALWDQSGNRKEAFSFEDAYYISDGEESLYVGNALACTAGYTASGTQLTTIWCNADTLTLWTNTDTSMTVSLPDHLVYDPSSREYPDRAVYVGENGYILVSLYSDPQSIHISETAIYDMVHDTWMRCAGDSLFSASCDPAMAKEQSLFAWIDTDNNLRFYDTASGSEITTIALQTPASSVSQMEFLLDDSCILIRNDDGMVFIYEIATGSLLFRSEASGYSQLTICPDTKNQRLYLIDPTSSGENGLCLDLRSWTLLTKLCDAMYFDAESSMLFCDIYQFLEDIGLVCFTVPSTGELVEMAQNLIG